jgi:hypothetical protein
MTKVQHGPSASTALSAGGLAAMSIVRIRTARVSSTFMKARYCETLHSHIRESPMTKRRPPAALLILASLAVAVAAAPGALADPVPAEQAAPAAAHRVAVRKAAYKVRRAPIPASGDVFGGTAAVPAASSGFAEAPMPNDEIAPAARTLSAVNTEPKLFTMKTQFRGDGYPYGATSQGLDDKYSVQVPGVDVTVPLQQ